MLIDVNKKRLKKMGAGVLTAALVIGAAAGFRVIYPGSAGGDGGQTVSQPSDTEGVNWGLSFGEEGKTPAGNGCAEEREGSGGIFRGWNIYRR